MLNKNSSYKKMTNTYKTNLYKSKASELLLTDFNKFPFVNSKAKTTKKKSSINHQTFSNNSLKIKNKKTKNDINNNDITNYLYENLGKKIGFKLISNKSQSKNGNNRINDYKDIKSIDILDNNIQKNSNENMKYNSVNNLIGININVNYMNKNYSINKPNSKKTNHDSSNNNSKNFHNNNINSNSFNEINSGNFANNSSCKTKTKLNKKNIFILNPINQDWEKIIENLKSKKRNKSKININDNIKSEKIIQNFINNNINTSTDDNNISSKTNNNIIEKSSSCKNINYIKAQKEKKTTNKYIYLYQNMNKKLKNVMEKKGKEKNIGNINYDNKLIKIISEYFLEYNKTIEDQYQKKIISEIFYQLNNIIKSKDEEIIKLKKEKEEILKLNKILKNKNEELINIKNKEKENDNINNKEGSFNASSISEDSSSVNSEELESIRFFDKIIMKKNSFSNIPELSFKKLNRNKNEKNNILPMKKNNMNKRHSFQGNKQIKNNKINNNKCKETKKNNINKNNKNIKLILQKGKNNEKNERNKPNIKSFINIFEKSRNKK